MFYDGFATCDLLVISGRKIGMFVFTTVRSVSCSSEHIAYARNERFFIPGMDGPNLGFGCFFGLRYPECATIHGN